MATENLRDGAIFQDFTVWLDASGKIGTVPSFQPPEINIQTEEFRGGGMDGTIEMPMGIEKIEFEFDVHTWDPEIFSSLGYGPGSIDAPITFRGWTISASGGQAPVIIYTRSLIKSVKPGRIQPGQKVELNVSCVANYYKHTFDSKTVTEIDVFGKYFFINGEDKTGDARRFLF